MPVATHASTSKIWKHTISNRHVSKTRENIDAQAASTDGRARLYANGQTHMFGRKGVIKKQRGGFK